MVITSFQRRANDRRRFMHGYDSWVERRVQEEGGVGFLTRYEIGVNGHARLTYKIDMRYRRKCRRYSPYAMKGEQAWKLGEEWRWVNI